MSASDPKLVEPVAVVFRSGISGLTRVNLIDGAQFDLSDGAINLVPASALEAAEARIAALEAENGALREKVERAAGALETAASRFNLMGGVGLVNGANPRVGYQEAYLAAKDARAALRQAEEKSDG